MGISKRTRYEVLKRDNHACRYCGGIAPDVKLHVDHVIPKSLGGTDKPDNLVAACEDCNLGKSSTSPDDALVAEVNEQALAYAQALRANIKKVTGQAIGLRKIRRRLQSYWVESADTYGLYSAPPMDPNFNTSLQKWLSLGLDEDFLMDAMDITMSKHGIAKPDRYRYFCGVIYRTLDKAHEETQAPAKRTTEDGVPLPEPCGHCGACRDGNTEKCATYAGPHCPSCDADHCHYATAFEEGQIEEHLRAFYAGFTYNPKGKCGHCEACLKSNEFVVEDCTVYHEIGEDEEEYKCTTCGRQDCLYDLGIQAGIEYEAMQVKPLRDHYRNCPEVNHVR